MSRNLYIAVPLMDELENLPVLLNNISAQDARDFKVFFCVNQPDSWWEDKERIGICERNIASVDYLEKNCSFPFRIIDRASKGEGWKGKQSGVGWARKLLMDKIADEANTDDIIITLDGDTTFNKKYFSSVRSNFEVSPESAGISVPYYHRRCGREAEDRAMLRYELYMRTYAINMWRINNPYHFTALGSAIAVPVSSYKAIGGITPRNSGEDFYFIQKLVKYGKLMTWNEEKVYPAPRFSDRVPFGTGPAMIKGARGDWDSYPIYHPQIFDEVKITYDAFDALYESDFSTPVGDYLQTVLKHQEVWAPLRKNSITAKQFRRACTEKVDALRIFQFLKNAHSKLKSRDEDCLYDLLKIIDMEKLKELNFIVPGFSFDELSVDELDQIRNSLTQIEEVYQKEHQYA